MYKHVGMLHCFVCQGSEKLCVGLEKEWFDRIDGLPGWCQPPFIEVFCDVKNGWCPNRTLLQMLIVLKD